MWAVLPLGEYHKNVRAEFASLVTTPDTAEHMDGLAFTRSIGDFHLQAYGITWQPDIVEIDLTNQISNPNMLIVASDGVWDNWKYEDVSNHFTDPAKVCSILGGNFAIIWHRPVDLSSPFLLFQRIDVQLFCSNGP